MKKMTRYTVLKSMRFKEGSWLCNLQLKLGRLDRNGFGQLLGCAKFHVLFMNLSFSVVCFLKSPALLSV